MCIDFGQLFALLWVAAQPWPWPYLWVHWTSWTVWLNLDYFSTTKDGALYGQTGNVGISRWGQMDQYLYYGLAFSALPLVTAAPLLLWRQLAPRQQSFVKMMVLLVWQLLYLPCGLGVFRLYYCENGGTLSADPAVSCSSSEYYMFAAISTVLVAPLLLGLPVYMYHTTYDLVVYNFRHDHEKRLQAWEITYGLGLDEYWLSSMAWVVSSFKRCGVYSRTIMLIMKLALLLIFVFVRHNLLTQAGLYLIVTILFCIPALRYRPFRLPSSNMIMAALIFTLLVATTAAMMNAAGVENATMVASRQAFFLWALFWFGALLIIAVAVWSALVMKDDWPSALTIGRINDSNMRPLVGKWIAAMAEANFVVSDCLNSVAEIRDLSDFNRVTNLVRSCWLNARSNGSLFEVMLGDVLEKLLIFHKHIFLPTNLRRNRVFLDSALQEAGPALLHRERSTVLMSRRKRSMLTKMTAMRAFLGGRVLDDSFAQASPSMRVGNIGNGLPSAESVASLQNYEGQSPIQSRDWGEERDRTKELLANLPDTVALTEDVLQSEDPSSNFQILLAVQYLWTEAVGLLDAGHMVQSDLPPPLTAEDCYTYRRLVEDCITKYDLGDDVEEGGANMHTWSEEVSTRKNSSDYDSPQMDLGSLVDSTAGGGWEDHSEEVNDYHPKSLIETEDANYIPHLPSSTEQSLEKIFKTKIPRELAPLKPLDHKPPIRLQNGPTTVHYRPTAEFSPEEKDVQAEPVVWKPAHLEPLPVDRLHSLAAVDPPLSADDDQNINDKDVEAGEQPSPPPSRGFSQDAPQVFEDSVSKGPSERLVFSPLAYSLDDDIVIEEEDDDESLALSIDYEPTVQQVANSNVSVNINPTALDDRAINPFELTPRRQGSDDSLDGSVKSE